MKGFLLSGTVLAVVCAIAVALLRPELGLFQASVSSTAPAYCLSTLDQMDSHAEQMLSALNAISTAPYFRYYKTNFDKECPYWAVSLICTSETSSCSVCTCDENDIPAALRDPADMSDVGVPDSHMLQTEPYPGNVDQWGAWQNGESGAEYVDLVQNPEANTGFVGEQASRIWRTIYSENCVATVANEEETAGGTGGETKCVELPFLRQLISGLQTSISTHVAVNFWVKDVSADSTSWSPTSLYNNPNMSFKPNCGLFTRVTGLDEFRHNLYLLHQFVLRALAKSKDQFMDNLSRYHSGENGAATAEDEHLKEELQRFFDMDVVCDKTFDENHFLSSPEKRSLVPQVQKLIRNITTVMDCVACEKCRIWGKLQTKGIATAIGIVMSPTPVELGRGDRVSLFNLARELTFAIRSLRVVGDHCAEDAAAEKATSSPQ